MHRGGKPQVDDINNIIAIYNKKFAGKYEAKMEFVEQNYNEKLLTLIASNSLADAFYMNAEVLPSFAYRGAFYDLTAIDKSDNATKDYWPELVEMSRYKGKLHGLPKDYSPYVIWVNKTRFKEAGVELPKPGWTWNDMMGMAEKLTKRDGNRITQYGLFGYGWNVSIWQNGGDFFDKDYTKATLDTPEAIEAIQWVADQNLKAKVAPIATDITSSGQNTYQWFGTGKMAMYFMGRWAVSQLRPLKDIEWDAYPLPKGKAEANVFLQSGPAVSAQTKAPEAAWEFCKVWTGPDGQQLNIDSGDSIPPLNSPAVREAYLGKTPPSKEGNQVFYDAIKIGHPLPTTGTFSWLEITQILNPELDLVWQGKQTASEAIKKTAPKLQELTTKK
jgi:multiple sugar transport system substrate-binding protein